MDRDAAKEIARITAAVASGEMAEEVGQRAIDALRRATGTDDSVVLDVAQTAASYTFGIGSGAADIAEVVTGGVFDLFDD